MMTKSPEPIVLAVALGLLALGSAGLAFTFPSLADIVGFGEVRNSGATEKKLKAEDLDASVASLKSPALWEEPSTKHRLFNPEDYIFFPALYPAGNYIQKLGPEARSPGGVPLSWYQKYGIDITSPTVDREDPDNDGFSNVTEFKNEQVGQKLKAADIADDSKSTNPNDPKSHPSYLSRLRLQKYESRPFHIKFNGYQQLNGVYEFQIVLKDVPSNLQPPFKKTGEPLGSEGYVVGDFHLSIVNKVNPATGVAEDVDQSTLDLIKPDIGLTTTVTYRKETDSPESTANFVMLMPSEVDKVIKVPRGKILTVPFIPETEAQYLIVDVTADTAKIRDVKTKKDYQIPKLDPAEWDEVPVAPQGNATKTP